MTPEGRVKLQIKKHLTAKGVWFAGQPPPPVVTGWMYMPVSIGMGVSGIPDFVGTYKCRPVFIEAKAPGGKPTDNQLERHKEIRTAGGVVIVADSVDVLEQEMKREGL